MIGAYTNGIKMWSTSNGFRRTDEKEKYVKTDLEVKNLFCDFHLKVYCK